MWVFLEWAEDSIDGLLMDFAGPEIHGDVGPVDLKWIGARWTWATNKKTETAGLRLRWERGLNAAADLREDAGVRMSFAGLLGGRRHGLLARAAEFGQ